MNHSIIAFVIIASAVVGCSKQQQSGVNANGTCDSSYRDSYNMVVSGVKTFKTYVNVSDGSLTSKGRADQNGLRNNIKNINSSCSSFLSNYNGVSCDARSEETYNEITTNSAEMESMCAMFKRIQAESDHQNNASATSVSEYTTAGAVDDWSSGESLELLAPEAQ